MFSRTTLVDALTRAADRAGSRPVGEHAEALRHIHAGRLLEATAAIQRSLGATYPVGRAVPFAPFGAATGSPPSGNSRSMTSTAGGTVIRGTFHGSTSTLTHRLYVPTQPRSPAPLLVMLHGGTQTADAFADATGMDEIAEREGFLVVYPEQSRSANAMGYWNWFRPGDQRRDVGEPSSIAGITRAVAADHDVDPGAIAVAGFSAGAAMAAVMAATYPDLYAGAGVHSGLACGAAHDVGSAFAAMRGAPTMRSAGGSANPIPLVVIHGDRDDTVVVANATRVVESAVGGREAPLVTSGQGTGGRSWTRRRWTTPGGRVLVEAWTVHGAGHAWSGGRAGGSYTDPSGPDASATMVEFFGFTRAPG